MSADLSKLIDSISGELLLVDTGNLHSVAQLLGQLEKLHKELAGAGFENGAKRIHQSVKSLEDFLLADMNHLQRNDPSIVLTSIGIDVSELQTALHRGNDIALQAAPVSTNGDWKLPSHLDAALFSDFITTQQAMLQQFEAAVLELEATKSDEVLQQIRRSLHTLKGEAGLFGLEKIEMLCHRLEDVLHPPVSEILISLLLATKDWLLHTIDALGNKESPHWSSDNIDRIIAKLTGTEYTPPVNAAPIIVNNNDSSDMSSSAPIATPVGNLNERDLDASADVEMLKDFITEASDHLNSAEEMLLELEQNPHNPEAVNTVFRAFHTIKGVAGLLGLDQIGTLAHEAENLLDGIRRRSDSITSATQDASFKSVDFLKRQLRRLGDSLSRNKMPGDDPELPQLIDLIRNALNKREVVKQVVAATQEAIETEKSDSLTEQLLAATKADESRSEKGSTVREPIRVDADRLDRLIDMIGELVISESMVQQDIGAQNNNSRLVRNASLLHKITRELQSSSLSLRMMQVRPVFQKMARMVRDLSKKFGKKVELSIEGEETELDKSVVDKIGDPLIHMIRNSIDHGIEDAPERIAKGKPETGKIKLRAYHQGGSIYIELSDDGRGLDRDAILAKARERGLCKPDETPSDHDIYHFVFHPGFSTAKKVTGISGRGVGMDVVRRNIESLRGSVEIKTEYGAGTTISLRLPLTLAIIDGMLIQVGEERYILPTLNIVESISLSSEQMTLVTGRGEMISFRGTMIPMFRLSRLFEIVDAVERIEKGIVVVVEAGSKKVALFADRLLGQQQVVIKNLGTMLEGTKGIAGGAILADGRVGLIVDIHGFVLLAQGNGE